MPTKSAHACKTTVGSLKRSKKQKEQGSVKIQISVEVEAQRRATVGELIPRERSQIMCRDVEFRGWLKRQYKKFCPELSPQYRGIRKESGATVEDCVQWISDFPGVNKKTPDHSIHRKYNLAEGRSWTDQRRSKHIVPLFKYWFGALKSAIAHMRANTSVTDAEVKEMMVDLLTKTYHPKSNQSNQTALVCVGSLNDTRMRRSIDDIAGIRYTQHKKQIGKFVSDIRERGWAGYCQDHSRQALHSMLASVDDCAMSDADTCSSDTGSEATSMAGSLSPAHSAVVEERDVLMRERNVAVSDAAKWKKKWEYCQQVIQDLQAAAKHATAVQQSSPSHELNVNPLWPFPISPTPLSMTQFDVIPPAMGSPGYSLDALSGSPCSVSSGFSESSFPYMVPTIHGLMPIYCGSMSGGYCSAINGSADFNNFTPPDVNGDVPMRDADKDKDAVWDVPFMNEPRS